MRLMSRIMWVGVCAMTLSYFHVVFSVSAGNSSQGLSSLYPCTGGTCKVETEIISKDVASAVANAPDPCLWFPCLNGGYCKKENGRAWCVCPGRFTGHICQTDPCLQFPCQNGGYCTVENGRAGCICPGRFTGHVCQTDPCLPFPCLNGGHCEIVNGRAGCVCKKGFNGHVCQHNLCIHFPCRNGGYCTVEGETARCQCQGRYSGRLCETDACLRHSCHNGGTCEAENGHPRCVCREGYAGPHCETVCNCGEHSKGCTVDSSGSKTCQCNDGYAQRGHQCEACNCGEHSKGCTFDGSGSKICQCDDGYAQRGEQCEVGCGVLHHCVNGGHCDKGICVCLPGTSGDFCEIVTECNDLCPNRDETKCTYNVEQKRPYCECFDKELFYDSEKQVCRRTCDSNKCENGGVCHASGESMFCKCLHGTSGDYCQEVDDCTPHKNFCKDEAKCYFDVEKKTADCECPHEKMAYDRHSEKCRGTCNIDVCENGGMCLATNPFNAMFCKCFFGTSGDHCEEVEGCLPHNNFCKDETVCHFDVEMKEAACKCLDKNMDYDKDHEKCRVPCNESILCKNNGECTGYDVKFCSCRSGTRGDLCERVIDCENPDFCGKKLDVTCVFDYQKSKGACQCEDESKKFDSVTKECKRTCNSNKDCINGGTCVEHAGYNFCECLKGTSGDLCQIVNDCENKISCKDGALCEFDVTTLGVVCRCKDAGKRYESWTESCKTTCKMLDDISSHSTCQNRGTCGGIADFLFCKCLPGTSGDLCETVDDCEKMVCKDNSTCVFNTEKEIAVCSCKDGKEYDPYNEQCRETCSRRECSNGGKCGDLNFCHCLRGTSGDFCESIHACDVLQDKCKDGAHCDYDIEEQDAVCRCQDPEKLYDTINERCKRECGNGSRNCSHGGKCGDLNFCQCLPGTMGDFCDTIEDCEKDEAKCKDGAYCDYDIAEKKAVCRCKYVGELYDPWSQRCKRTCDEANSICRNGGICGGTGNLRFCKCLSGTRGDLCNIVDECEKNQDKCKNGSECVFDIKNQRAECSCKVDGEQYDLLNERCKKTCRSAGDCLNGGVCMEVNRAKFCECISGTSGDTCEGVDDCQTGIYKKCKGDEGTCKFDVVEKKAKCECSGDKEFDDKSGICRVCDCGSYAVSCSFSNGGKTCTCLDGFTERNGACEKTKCTEKSCDNGKCKIINGQEVCSCFEGYALEGDNCEKLNCSKTVCINGSCIVRRSNTEECLCGAGFTLVENTCKKGICGIGTCFGGICETVEDELICVCPKGYHLDGIGCYATPCKEQICYGGKCVVKDNKETCRCREGNVLVNNVCKKVLCDQKSCFGGQCHLVDGKEKCTCVVGYTIYDDVCRADLR